MNTRLLWIIIIGHLPCCAAQPWLITRLINVNALTLPQKQPDRDPQTWSLQYTPAYFNTMHDRERKREYDTWPKNLDTLYLIDHAMCIALNIFGQPRVTGYTASDYGTPPTIHWAPEYFALEFDAKKGQYGQPCYSWPSAALEIFSKERPILWPSCMQPLPPEYTQLVYHNDVAEPTRLAPPQDESYRLFPLSQIARVFKGEPNIYTPGKSFLDVQDAIKILAYANDPANQHLYPATPEERELIKAVGYNLIRYENRYGTASQPSPPRAPLGEETLDMIPRITIISAAQEPFTESFPDPRTAYWSVSPDIIKRHTNPHRKVIHYQKDVFFNKPSNRHYLENNTYKLMPDLPAARRQLRTISYVDKALAIALHIFAQPKIVGAGTDTPHWASEYFALEFDPKTGAYGNPYYSWPSRILEIFSKERPAHFPDYVQSLPAAYADRAYTTVLPEPTRTKPQPVLPRSLFTPENTLEHELDGLTRHNPPAESSEALKKPMTVGDLITLLEFITKPEHQHLYPATPEDQGIITAVLHNLIRYENRYISAQTQAA